jgi:hypothetical protein
MEARMGLLGAAALGFVSGWVCFLVARGTRGMFGMSLPALGFAAAMFFGATALALIHVGSNGALTTSIGVGAGALAACAVFWIAPAASSVDQNGG